MVDTKMEGGVSNSKTLPGTTDEVTTVRIIDPDKPRKQFFSMIKHQQT